MINPQNDMLDLPSSQKPLRVWPGAVAVIVLLLARYGIPEFAPDTIGMYSIMVGAPLGVLAFVVWWAGFSRSPHLERWGALIIMVVALLATPLILHQSIATGMMGVMFLFYALPVLILAFVGWALVSNRLSLVPRRVTMVATILLACLAFTLVRTDGMTGDGAAQFAWRWSPTHEERLLAQGVDQPVPAQFVPKADDKAAAPETSPTPAVTAKVQPAEQLAAKADDKAATTLPVPAEEERQGNWPGFRGPKRDGVIHGVQIKTDWSTTPPVELWRRPVGPGWSSFAVNGQLFYTQEQLGNDEVVGCYNVTTGKPVWRHRNSTRFYESNAGAGPRATPTLNNGRVYSFGATGILNALDAGTGAVRWTRNVASDTGTKVPTWGFASSPLVVHDTVIVSAEGKLAAYDVSTGKQRWVGPTGGWGYSSPQFATIGGVAQILLLNGAGAISVSPADGTLLWEHKWPGDGIVQPALTADGDVLIGTGSGMGGSGAGIRRISVDYGSGDWKIEERWTSIGLKPYYNDFVIDDGYAFGFDGSILACIDLKDGKRKWKGGRYGHGQLVLLPDQDLLMVLSEEGEVALVSAAPNQFVEFARFRVLEGKTWNHPVLIGNLLLARNSEQMAAFRIPIVGR
jgi:outer membrane protein assembly factor BamB